MKRLSTTLLLALVATTATAQPWLRRPTGPDYPTGNEVVKAIYEEGMNNTGTADLAQVLADVIGPRLTAAPGHDRGVQWAIETLGSWGIEAEAEQYGTWRSWRRGISHMDLVQPRVRSLEGTLLGWSPGTDGPKEGGTVLLPEVDGPAAFRAWLPEARGRFVLLTQAEPSCRPAISWTENGLPDATEAFETARTEARDAWTARVDAIGMERQEIVDALEEAGAIGFLTNYWTGGWGTERIFPLTYSFRGAMNRRAAAFNLSCEDYGLVYRLTEKGQGAVVRAVADAEDLGEQPVNNVIGRIPGTELPNEYVLLSAHFDSWDGSSGMTDNGTGSVVMLEAMRILKKLYPNPKRTILIGLWGAEEQGLIGSRAFVADHPEIVDHIQAVFNQDNGTGRIRSISTSGLTRAGEFFARWFSAMPQILVGDIDLNVPGSPGSGGTDYASFICAGAPAFNLSATSFDYFTATWHTNRDTYDKLSFEDLKRTATVTAMLTYLASEDQAIPRDRRDLGSDPRTGEPREWPACQNAARETMDRFK